MNHSVQSCWKKYVVLNNIAVKKYCPSVIWFSQCEISVSASVVLNIFWYRILGADSGEDS